MFELVDRFGIGPIEIAVFALAESISAHVDRGAEELVLAVQPTQCRGLVRRDELREKRAAGLVQLGGDRVPVRLRHQNSRAARTSAGSSRSSRNFFRSRPPAYPVSL